MTKETKKIKLGVINVQAVVLQTPGVASLREKEQKKREDLQVWINARNAEIAAADENKKPELTKKYQDELNERQQKMQEEYAAHVQELDSKLNKLIAKVAEKEGIDYVFNLGSLIYGGVDITPLIIEGLKK